MNNNIDKLFKKALDHQEYEAPAHCWENIDKHFSTRKKRRSLIFWWSSGVAAACVLLLSLTNLWEIQHEQFDVPYPYNIVLLEDKEITSSIPVKMYVPVEVNIGSPKKTTQQRGSQFKKWLSPVELQSHMQIAGLETTTLPTKLKPTAIRKGFIPLTNADKIITHKTYNKLLAAETSGIIPEKKKEKIEISLSGHIAPVYASGNYKTTSHQARGYNYNKEQMKGIFNVSGGVRVSLAATSRLSLQTGINYSSMGQETEENNIYAPRSTYRKTGSNVGNSVYTPLGRIKNKAKTTVFRTEGMDALTHNTTGQGSIEQVFGAIEIPFGLKYQLNDNKLKFSILGGVSSSFMVNNKAYLKYDGQKEYMGSTEDIRNFNLATNIGFGIEYPISRAVKVMLEPDFKYYLRSISSNGDFDFKPYAFTFSTGIGINF